MEALKTSLIVAGTTALLSSIMGTMAALGLQNVRGLPRMIFDSLIYIAIMIPGIVFGIATLVALATALDFINPLLKTLWPVILGEAPRLKLRLISITCAHTLWTTALATVIIRARVQGMDTEKGRSVVRAEVPMAEMMRYTTELRSITGGRGVFSMEFSRYETVPTHLADGVIEARKREEAEKES